MFDDAPIISRYTRAQAIEDGVLVDLMQPDTAGAVREAGFTYPVAMTAAAFELAVWPITGADATEDTEAERWLKSHGQDLQGRLWDVLWMLRLACRRVAPGQTTVVFRVSLRDHHTRRQRVVTLKSVCGPDDDFRPCLTIMLPGED